jgi:ABC-type polysaccharide/polyol phosphate export permease
MLFVIVLMLIYALMAVITYTVCDVKPRAPENEKYFAVLTGVFWPIAFITTGVIWLIDVIKEKYR